MCLQTSFQMARFKYTHNGACPTNGFKWGLHYSRPTDGHNPIAFPVSPFVMEKHFALKVMNLHNWLLLCQTKRQLHTLGKRVKEKKLFFCRQQLKSIVFTKLSHSYLCMVVNFFRNRMAMIALGRVLDSIELERKCRKSELDRDIRIAGLRYGKHIERARRLWQVWGIKTMKLFSFQLDINFHLGKNHICQLCLNRNSCNYFFTILKYYAVYCTLHSKRNATLGLGSSLTPIWGQRPQCVKKL